MEIKVYRTIILPVVLYGLENLSLTLRVFENRVQRRIFGSKRDKITGKRRLRYEKLYYLYFSTKKMRWEGHVARMGRGKLRCIRGFGGET
jgi:hypothetical protein